MGKISEKYGFEYENKKEYDRKQNKIVLDQKVKSDPEYYNKRFRKWYKQNKEKSDNQSKIRHRTLIKRKIEYLGGKCTKCGIDDKRVLQLHHKNKPKKGEMRQASWKLIKNGEVELLCANCHLIVHYEKSETTNREV